jgi:formylglycine-generating enzyme required for sulfatase activity
MTTAQFHLHPGTHSSKGLLIALALALPVGLVAGTLFHGMRIKDIPQAFQAPAFRPLAGSRPELEPQTVEVPAHEVRYRPAGSFSLNGTVSDAPLITIPARPLSIMRHEVSAAEYERCVAARACKASRQAGGAAGLPAVNVSWEDAAAYAAWLSKETGQIYRLPTDEEWIAAAGSKMPENAVLPGSASNPATRWLAEYEAEANRDPAEREPKPLGSGGLNEYGVADLAGNVWEWTDSCFIRAGISDEGHSFRTATVNCGVRVVEGQHRAYLPDFVRDARGGACSTGKPPGNLGFRLVREER